MVVQYLIDWDGLFPSNMPVDSRLCERLIRLSAMIRRNGCLIKSRYSSLVKARLLLNDSELLSGVLSEFGSLYEDFGIRVDEGGNADDLSATKEAWERYLRSTGVSPEKNDQRFVLISKESRPGSFFSQKTLDELFSTRESLAVKWARLQHFRSGRYSEFKRYFEAFSATASECVRIYDPYISLVFDTVERSENRKAWRNSFSYFLDVLLRNRNINKIDVITSVEIKQLKELTSNGRLLLFDEVVDDLIRRYSSRDGNHVAVSFHFVSSGRSFHDRFVSNGRFCFAIGHGCDICEVDDSFMQLLRQMRQGVPILRMQWRNMPVDQDRRFSDFNVFYGCSKNDVPREIGEIGVFEKDVVDIRGKAKMYPANCSAKKLSDIADKFRWGRYANGEQVQNPVAVVNDVAVNVNPREIVNKTDEDDF